MPTQRSVAIRFWTSLSLRGVSPMTRLVMLYCMTCPRSTFIGFFRFSLDDCMDETGLTRKQIEAAMSDAESLEFLEWDRHTHYVWVCKRVSYEFPNCKLSDKQLMAVRRILEDAPKSSIKFRLCEAYKGYGIPFMDGYGNGTDPYPDPSTTEEVLTTSPSARHDFKKSTPSSGPDPNVKLLLDYYHDTYLAVHKTKPVISGGKDGAICRKILAGRTLEEARWIVREHLEHPPDLYERKNLYGLSHILAAANTILARREGERP